MRAIVLAVLLVGLARCGCDDEPDGPAGTPIVKRVEAETELIGGLEAAGRVGDYLLANEKARFIVQHEDSATGWGLYGGALLDVGGPAGQPASDRLQELFVQCDLRAFNPTSAEIVSDGRDGSPGILRLVGEDAGIPFLDGIVIRDPLQVKITVDFVLAANSDTLELIIQVKDLKLLEPRDVSCGLIMLRGDQSHIFLEGVGDEADQAGGEQPYIAAAAHDAPQSWILYRKNQPLNVVLAQLEIVPIGPTAVELLANATIEERYMISIGARGDIESALEAMRLQKGLVAEGREVRLTLERPGAIPLPLEHAVLTVSRVDAARDVPITAAKADAAGLARFVAPAGTYHVQLAIEDRDVERFDLEVPAGDGPFEAVHPIQGLGHVRVRTTEIDLSGSEVGPTPARVFVINGRDAPVTGGRPHGAYVLADDGFFMPAGDYTIWVARGPAHEMFRQTVRVEAGVVTEVEARVQRVVDLGDWVTADLHVHGTNSADSQVAKKQRVLGAIAEGLDILIATDHDTLTDYSVTAKELGVQRLIHTVVGCEMSMLYGHMNGWPLELPGGREAHWSPPWFVYEDGRFSRSLEPIEVAAALRAKGAEIVQINHPRDGTGVFGYIGLDPDTGESVKPWPEPNAAELLNGKRLGDYPDVLRDFFGLMKKGRRVTGVGSSDSHSNSGQGYARTLIKGPGGPAIDVDLAAVWRSLREGRAVAMNGAFVFASARHGAERAEIGDTLPGGGPISIDVRVEAASHIDVDQLTLFENGVPIRRRPIRPSDADPARPAVRLSLTLTATPTADSFYMLEVRGGENPPFFDETISITNPIFVDVP